ncbi:MAG: hypothetical protein U0359_31300 [Byssovorax sp.]
MSETNASHVQKAKDTWKKLLDDQVSRVEQLQANIAKAEAEGAAQMTTAMQAMSKLSLDTFAYYGELSTAFRKLSLDAMKKTTDLLTPQG